MENARRKAQAVWRQHPDSAVLGADTVVYQHGKVLGKPKDQADAKAMLRSLSGAWHTVYTGVCVITPDGKADVRFDASRVQFVPLTDADIDWYIATGEPMDKAGAYGIQEMGALFVSHIEGDFYAVMGLPLCRLAQVLPKFGVFPLRGAESGEAPA